MKALIDEQGKKYVSFGSAVLCIAALVVVLMLGFAIWQIDTKVVFVLALVVVSSILMLHGFKLEEILKFFVDGCHSSMDVVLILMSVGAVIGTWIISGVVPTIIYYGLEILTPSAFLLTGFFLCCIVSFFVGSSYSTIATMGVAFLGIGMGLGINPGLTAGMVVSGALFGDKMSPFSDTTNLAPAAAGTNIYKHINSMLYTTIPAMIITIILYAIHSMRFSADAVEIELVEKINTALVSNFNITPILLIVPVFTIFLIVRKIPPVIAMLMSSCFAIIMALIFQSNIYDFKTILNALGNGVSKDFGVPEVNRLLNRGGIIAMMDVVAWTFLTLGLGEILRGAGVIDAFLTRLLKIVKKPRGLVLSTLLFSLVTACLTASQYLAILLPGQLMRDAYTKFKVDKRVLSRTLEDGGTMFSFLIPWDTAGIYTSSVLGVSVLSYAPYAYLLLASPIIAAIYAFTGFAIFKDESQNGEIVKEVN